MIMANLQNHLKHTMTLSSNKKSGIGNTAMDMISQEEILGHEELDNTNIKSHRFTDRSPI